MLLELLNPTATDDERAFALLAIERSGVSDEQLAEIQRHYGLNDQAILTLLSINSRTLQRRRSENQRFTASESSILLDVSRVLAYASSVFGDNAKVNRWLRRPNRALAEETPLALLATSTGRGLVQDVLGRIEYGIFA